MAQDRDHEAGELLRGRSVTISRVSVLGGVPQLFKQHKVTGGPRGLRGANVSFMPAAEEGTGGYAGLDPFLVIFENGMPRWSGHSATTAAAGADDTSPLATLWQVSVVVRGDIVLGIWRGEELFHAGGLPALCLPFHSGFVSPGVLRVT